MKATDRHRERVAELLSEPMEGDDFVEIDGETSDTVRTVGPAAGGAISELLANYLKSGEEEKKKKALESSEGFVAEKAAQDAEKRAALASADAITETDPSGPKHRAAADLATQAQSARAKADYFKQQAGMAAARAPGGAPGMPGAGGMAAYQPQETSIFTTRNMLIGGGILGGLVVLGLLLRRK